MKRRLANIFAAAGIAVVAMATSGTPAGAEGSSLRRLTDAQYRQIVLDVFGPTIKVNLAQSDTALREDGLEEVGNRRATITDYGLAQYEAAARDIASQVVSEANRSTLIPCEPKVTQGWDKNCGEQYLSAVGRLLFRRPLQETEHRSTMQVAEAAALNRKDFYAGLAEGLSNLLIAPQVLFRWETTRTAQNGTLALDAYSMASRLSFFLWNSGPDPLLLQAAQSGELATDAGLRREVDRMLASPKLEQGTRAFFRDMFHFDLFGSLVKDSLIYPKFGPLIVQDAEEQTLRTVVDHLLVQRADYRDLFTTRRTFLTPSLGAIYRVPIVADFASGLPGRWSPYEFPESDPRAGILMQVGFLALHSHPGRSSPTLRGRAVREMLFCQKVPDPPANVQFNIFQDASNPLHKTARSRLEAHRTSPACAGCHKITDPIGLALEVADSDGQYRTRENDELIDTSGTLDGVKFVGPVELGAAVRNHPATTSCLVHRVYSYGTGRAMSRAEAPVMEGLEKQFAADKFDFVALLRDIAVSDAFYSVASVEMRTAEVTAR